MRKVLVLGAVLCLFSNSFAISNVTAPVLRADQVLIPVGKTGQRISYAQLATISMADLQALTGKKMNFIQKMNFRMAQARIRKSIAADGTIKNKRIANIFMNKGKAGESGFNLGGFALGFFLGLIGVLLAYVVFTDEAKQNRIKWSWIGLGVAVLLWIILVVAVFAAAATTVP